ncbi:MAG: pseudouridine synthase [Dorea longicatena]
MATLNILYEDPHILVCVKPHGIATQSKSIRYPDMVSLIKNHLAKSSGSRNPGSAEPYLAVIHRLDQPVAGILVFAKTPAAAKDLNKQLQNQGFGKYYRALVANTPSTKEGTLKNYMVKDARTNTSRICSAKENGSKIARLHYDTVPVTDWLFTALLLSTELSWKSIWIPAAIIRSVYNSHLSVVRLLEIPNIIRNFLTPRAGRQSGCVLIN